MAAERYREELCVHNHYTNYKGRLFVKTLCDLFNDVAEAQTVRLGVDVATLNKSGLTWMLHRLHLLIHKMPLQGEAVVVETWPSGVDRLFALRDYRLLRPEGEELVRATSEWMTVDLNRRRPVRPLPYFVELSESGRAEKLPITPRLQEKEVPEEMPDGRRFEATFDHIDFNGHVTMASYMRWMINSLPFEFLVSHHITEVEAVYEHEILPDSEIVSSYAVRQGKDGEETVVYHRVRSADGRLTHCVAITVWRS